MDKLYKCEYCNEIFNYTYDGKHCSESCYIKSKKCEACGYYNRRAMEQHHMLGRKRKSLITLCANCHAIFHRTAGTRVKDYSRRSKKDVIYIIKEQLR